MSKEANSCDREQWSTPEEIERGRAAVLEKLDRIRQWLAESPPDVLEERFRAEWRSRCGSYPRFRAHEWEAAKAVHESEVRRFAGLVANGDLISATVRGLLQGKPFAASEVEDDGEIPF
jgi:hypothetical protein